MLERKIVRAKAKKALGGEEQEPEEAWVSGGGRFAAR
jgi:hypothetical protein